MGVGVRRYSCVRDEEYLRHPHMQTIGLREEIPHFLKKQSEEEDFYESRSYSNCYQHHCRCKGVKISGILATGTLPFRTVRPCSWAPGLMMTVKTK